MNRFLIILFNVFKGFSAPVYNFLIAIIAIKQIGKLEWGNFVQILLWVSLITFLANFGNKEYLLRRYSREPGKINEHFFTHLFTRFPLILSVCLLAFLLPLEIAWLACLLGLMIFIFQSFDSIITHYQLFHHQLAAETIGFILISAGLFFSHEASALSVLVLYIIAIALKIGCLLPFLQLDLRRIKWKMNFEVLKDSVPFFLIGLSGWLSSKVDLYVASICFVPEKLAEYQVLITAFLMIQSIAGLIVTPFTKHIYRLRIEKIQTIKYKVAMMSFFIVIPATLFIWAILENVIRMNLSVQHYIVCGLLSMPVYFFIIDILEFYKRKREVQVMYLNFLAFGIKLAALVVLLVFFQSRNLLDFLWIILCSELVMLGLYKSKVFR